MPPNTKNAPWGAFFVFGVSPTFPNPRNTSGGRVSWVAHVPNITNTSTMACLCCWARPLPFYIAPNAKNTSFWACFCCWACHVPSTSRRTAKARPQGRAFAVGHIPSPSTSRRTPKTRPEGRVFAVGHAPSPSPLTNSVPHPPQTFPPSQTPQPAHKGKFFVFPLPFPRLKHKNKPVWARSCLRAPPLPPPTSRTPGRALLGAFWCLSTSPSSRTAKTHSIGHVFAVRHAPYPFPCL